MTIPRTPARVAVLYYLFAAINIVNALGFPIQMLGLRAAATNPRMDWVVNFMFPKGAAFSVAVLAILALFSLVAGVGYLKRLAPAIYLGGTLSSLLAIAYWVWWGITVYDHNLRLPMLMIAVWMPVGSVLLYGGQLIFLATKGRQILKVA